MNTRVQVGSLWALLLAFMIANPTGAGALDGAPGGLLALPHGADIIIVDAANGQSNQLTLAGDALISMLAWSPDRQRIAASRSSRRPGETAYGQDIEVLDASTGQMLSKIERDASGIVLDSPVWSSDGQWIYFERQEAIRFGLGLRIDRARADGSERSLVLDNAHGPALSPDGTSLLSIRLEKGETLIRSNLDGSNPQPITPPERYMVIMYPRFSPDGEWIAFATITDPTRFSPPPGTPGVMQSLGAVSPSLGRHGIPWDIWIARPDGSDLRALRLGEDDPSLVWAPDSVNLAIYGGQGLMLLNRSGEYRTINSDIIGYGGIDWAR